MAQHGSLSRGIGAVLFLGVHLFLGDVLVVILCLAVVGTWQRGDCCGAQGYTCTCCRNTEYTSTIRNRQFSRSADRVVAIWQPRGFKPAIVAHEHRGVWLAIGRQRLSRWLSEGNRSLIAKLYPTVSKA
jgi:hypothetical protein